MTKIRIRIVFTLLVFIFFLIWLRLAYWQLVQTSVLSRLFRHQSSRTIIIQAKPGKIISEDNFVLATSHRFWRLGFNPQLCSSVKNEIINKYLSYQKKQDREVIGYVSKLMSQKSLAANLFNSDKVRLASDSAYWQGQEKSWLARLNNPKIKWLELASVNDEFLSSLSSPARHCLFTYPINKRFYPDPLVDSYFLGFRGLDKNNQPIGYFGLEGYYNQELAGLKGEAVYQYDALGHLMPQLFSYRKPALNGRDLHLFLSYNFQYLAQQALSAGVKKYQASSGTIIILNPENMAVLAMTSYPHYQARYYKWYQNKAFLNPAIANLYEPGSTFKTLIMSLAIDLNKVKPDTVCPVCSGPLVSQGGVIKTWNDRYYPNSTMTEVIVHSDNVGMAWLAGQIGKKELYQFLVKAGFGQKTGVDLQDDQINPLKPLPKWYPINVLTAGFGQGIFLTPLKLAQLEATIARGGEMIPPRMVNYLSDGDKKYPTKISWKKRLFSAKASREVSQMMVKVVNQGSVKWTRLPGLEVAGKTGTAQVAIKGKYDPNKTIASFVGFWPVEHPRYLILVKLDFPQASPWGSETAAPIFFKLAKKINLISQP